MYLYLGWFLHHVDLLEYSLFRNYTERKPLRAPTNPRLSKVWLPHTQKPRYFEEVPCASGAMRYFCTMKEEVPYSGKAVRSALRRRYLKAAGYSYSFFDNLTGKDPSQITTRRKPLLRGYALHIASFGMTLEQRILNEKR